MSRTPTPFLCACLVRVSVRNNATGTFGRVLECWDRQRQECVAVKVIRNVDKYRHAAMIEVRLLFVHQARNARVQLVKTGATAASHGIRWPATNLCEAFVPETAADECEHAHNAQACP